MDDFTYAIILALGAIIGIEVIDTCLLVAKHLTPWAMSSNLTRFYLDFDQECRTGCLNGKAFEDVEKSEADAMEERLQQEEISYIRIDL